MKKKQLVLVILAILFVIISFTNEKYPEISIVASCCFVIAAFIIHPIIMLAIDKKMPRVVGKVRDIRKSSFPGRSIVTLEFEYNGESYEIDEGYNDEDLPTIDAELKIVVNIKNIATSTLNESNSQFSNFLLAIALLTVLIYKLLHLK